MGKERKRGPGEQVEADRLEQSHEGREDRTERGKERRLGTCGNRGKGELRLSLYTVSGGR